MCIDGFYIKYSNQTPRLGTAEPSVAPTQQSVILPWLAGTHAVAELVNTNILSLDRWADSRIRSIDPEIIGQRCASGMTSFKKTRVRNTRMRIGVQLFSIIIIKGPKLILV